MLLFWFTILATAIAELATRDSAFTGKKLRILPLGASITWGQGSSNGNGYREDLRNLLSPAEVTFIGSQCSGTMQNGNSEGHPGYRIDQMQAVAAQDIALQPNVVLVYVGTNDMLASQASQAPGAPARMQQLVSYLTGNLPNALIVVSKLFLDSDPQVEARIRSFDANLDMTRLGNVIIADLSNTLTTADLGSDGEHPNDSGYAKMAQVFSGVLAQAIGAGRIADPVSIQYTPQCNGPPVAPISIAPTPTTTFATSPSSAAATSPSSTAASPVSSAALATPSTTSTTLPTPSTTLSTTAAALSTTTAKLATTTSLLSTAATAAPVTTKPTISTTNATLSTTFMSTFVSSVSRSASNTTTRISSSSTAYNTTALVTTRPTSTRTTTSSSSGLAGSRVSQAPIATGSAHRMLTSLQKESSILLLAVWFCFQF